MPSVAGATAAPGLLQSSCTSASDLIRKKKIPPSLPRQPCGLDLQEEEFLTDFRTSETRGLTRQLNTFLVLEKLPKALERERPPSCCELLLQIKSGDTPNLLFHSHNLLLSMFYTSSLPEMWECLRVAPRRLVGKVKNLTSSC